MRARHPHLADPGGNDINLVNGETSLFGQAVHDRLTAGNKTLKHFQDLFRTDPVKLHSAAVNFGGKWKLETEEERRIAQGLALGVQQQYWYSVAPLALDQWIIGPGHTDINTNGVQDLPDRGTTAAISTTTDGSTALTIRFPMRRRVQAE